MLCVCIQQATNHALILRVVFLSFTLEELDASLAQGECYFHSILSEDEIFWWWEEIRNYHGLPHRFIRVLYFRAHKLPCPFSSIRLREFE